MTGVLRGWGRAPRPVRTSATVAVLVLAHGTVVHLVQPGASSAHPYPGLPGWPRAYVVALTVLVTNAASSTLRRGSRRAVSARP